MGKQTVAVELVCHGGYHWEVTSLYDGKYVYSNYYDDDFDDVISAMLSASDTVYVPHKSELKPTKHKRSVFLRHHPDDERHPWEMGMVKGTKVTRIHLYETTADVVLEAVKWCKWEPTKLERQSEIIASLSKL